LFEFRERLITQFSLFGSRTRAVQKILLLQFAQPLKNVRSILRFQAGQFSKDFRFAHGVDLIATLDTIL